MPALVTEHFLDGSTYLHISGIGIEYSDLAELTNKIRGISQQIGRLTLTNHKPNSDVWLLDSRTSPKTQLVEAHTDNPFKDKPEDIIAFWNIRSSAHGGENVITSLDRILELGGQSKRLKECIEQASSLPHTYHHGERSWSGPVFNLDDQIIRYDAKYLDEPNIELKYLFEKAIEVGEVIKLAPGDVLFINNKTTAHARLPYTDQSRLSIRTRIDL